MSREYISAFTVLGIRFIRRPVSELPKEGTYVFVDNGVDGGWTDRQPAVLSNGSWIPIQSKKLRFSPMFWSQLAEQSNEAE